MILEVKDSKKHVTVYGYEDVYEWLDDIVAAYETEEMLDDFIPSYLSVKLNGQYLSIVDEGKLDPEYKKVMRKIKVMSDDERHVGNMDKIVIDETEKDMLIAFKH